MIRSARLLYTVAPFIIGWILAAAIVTNAIRPEEQPPRVVIGLVLGTAMGLSSTWFELVAIPRYARRLSPGLLILARSLFYAGISALYIVLVIGWSVRDELGIGFFEAFQEPLVLAFLSGPSFRMALGLFALTSLAFNFIRQIRLMLGPGTLWALLIGRYRVPVHEDRAFLFLDLTDSTGLAQTLGPDRFHAFKNEFFRDVAEPILATGGRITQYVGDEVLITWRIRNGHLARSPVETFIRLDAAIAARAAFYRKTFGVVPTYKAGLHCGEVVTAEVGELKKDIVHSGDTVNVAARIEGACHSMKARLLISEAALALAPLPEGVTSEHAGTVELRGRSGSVRLHRVLGASA